MQQPPSKKILNDPAKICDDYINKNKEDIYIVYYFNI